MNEGRPPGHLDDVELANEIAETHVAIGRAETRIDDWEPYFKGRFAPVYRKLPFVGPSTEEIREIRELLEEATERRDELAQELRERTGVDNRDGRRMYE